MKDNCGTRSSWLGFDVLFTISCFALIRCLYCLEPNPIRLGVFLVHVNTGFYSLRRFFYYSSFLLPLAELPFFSCQLLKRLFGLFGSCFERRRWPAKHTAEDTLLAEYLYIYEPSASPSFHSSVSNISSLPPNQRTLPLHERWIRVYEIRKCISLRFSRAGEVVEDTKWCIYNDFTTVNAWNVVGEFKVARRGKSSVVIKSSVNASVNVYFTNPSIHREVYRGIYIRISSVSRLIDELCSTGSIPDLHFPRHSFLHL